MKSFSSSSVYVALVTLLAIVGVPLLTLAQQEDPIPGSGQALEISPTVRTLEVDPGETTTIELNVTNVSNIETIASAQINDFVASGEGGTPKILLDEEEMEDNPYSFREWVQPIESLLLTPGERKTLPITIQVPNNASPGGHYGVVRFSTSAPDVEDNGVSLAASVGTLMLVNVSGETERSLDFEEFSVSRDGEVKSLFENAPLDFTLRLKNTGNTHVQPSGKVYVKDMFGKSVANLNVNLPPRNILPSSIRRFDVPLDGRAIGDKWLFGRYTATAEIKYSPDDFSVSEEDSVETITETITFWVIPYRLIGLAVVVLVIIFFVLRSSIRRYNQKIIAKAQKRK